MNLYSSPEEVFEKLRRRLPGWVNYFCYGTVNGVYRELRNFLYDLLK